jgi:hypothetical protein
MLKVSQFRGCPELGLGKSIRTYVHARVDCRRDNGGENIVLEKKKRLKKALVIYLHHIHF